MEVLCFLELCWGMLGYVGGRKVHDEHLDHQDLGSKGVAGYGWVVSCVRWEVDDEVLCCFLRLCLYIHCLPLPYIGG